LAYLWAKSIVQKGKLAAAALAEVSALKIVDLPTFGSPIIPQVNPTVIPLFENVGRLKPAQL
jgi:hypothetical protein